MRASPMLPARIQSCTPCRDGMSPVRSDARAGEHTGDVQKKLSKRMPARRARRAPACGSRGCRAQPSAHAPWSSLMMNSTFGRAGSLLAMRSSWTRSCRRERRARPLAVRLHNRLCAPMPAAGCKRASTHARMRHPGGDPMMQAQVHHLRPRRARGGVGVDGQRGAERQLEAAPHRRGHGAEGAGARGRAQVQRESTGERPAHAAARA